MQFATIGSLARQKNFGRGVAKAQLIAHVEQRQAASEEGQALKKDQAIDCCVKFICVACGRHAHQRRGHAVGAVGCF